MRAESRAPTPPRRALAPRPALAIRPLTVTPDTAFALLGVTARVFRERVLPLCRAVAYLTPRLPVVALDEVERVLAELSRAGATDEAEREPANDAGGEAAHGGDDEPLTADAVLARLGRKRAAGGAR